MYKYYRKVYNIIIDKKRKEKTHMYKNKLSTLILAVGLPGSGKTTKLKSIYAQSINSYEEYCFIDEENDIEHVLKRSNNYRYLVDRLHISKEDVFATLEKISASAKSVTGEDNPTIINELKIIIFDKDLKACLHNDSFRSKERSAALTIKNRANDLEVEEFDIIASENYLVESVTFIHENVVESSLAEFVVRSHPRYSFKDDIISISLGDAIPVDAVEELVRQYKPETSEIQIRLDALEIIANANVDVTIERDYYYSYAAAYLQISSGDLASLETGEWILWKEI